MEIHPIHFLNASQWSYCEQFIHAYVFHKLPFLTLGLVIVNQSIITELLVEMAVFSLVMYARFLHSCSPLKLHFSWFWIKARLEILPSSNQPSNLINWWINQNPSYIFFFFNNLFHSDVFHSMLENVTNHIKLWSDHLFLFTSYSM